MGKMQRFSITIVLFLLTIIAQPKDIFASFTPPAKLTFTFDVSGYDTYDKLVPILEAKNLPGVIYGETGPLGSGESWVISWSKLREYRDRLGWEIGSHTITHPDLTTLTDADLEKELRDSKAAFASNGIIANTFASPLGAYNTRVIKAASKYYNSHRAAWGGPNVWPAIYNDYELVSLEVKHNIPPEEVMGWVDEAVANKQWLVLLLHDVVEGTPVEYQYNINDFKRIVDYISGQPIKVVTISNGLNLGTGSNLLANGSFEQIAGGFAPGWNRSTTTGITINSNNNGNFPNPKNSLRIVGAASQRTVSSDLIPVAGSNDYALKLFANASNLTKGGWGVWVNEYNASSIWISGQWLGGDYAPRIGTKYFSYTPTSANVSQIEIEFYTEPNSIITLFIDSAELKLVNTTVPTPGPSITPTLIPTNIPTPIATIIPTPIISPSPVPSPTTTPASGPNLIINGDFETLDESGFASGWDRDDTTNILIDTGNNGYLPSVAKSLKIPGGATQRTAISSTAPIEDTNANYLLSYYLKVSNYVSGGTAAYIDEFDAIDNWIGGQWLGGRYGSVNEMVMLQFKPKMNTRKIKVHIFTETNSNMTIYADEVKLLKI